MNGCDPYPFFRRLREEDPVHWCEPMNLWLVTRYDDVLAGLRDPRLSSNRMSMYTQTLGAAGIAAIVMVVNCSARTTWTTVELRTNVVTELSRLTSHFSEAAKTQGPAPKSLSMSRWIE